MKRFSEREGLKKVRTQIQVDYIDQELRNCLWSLVHAYYMEPILSCGTFKYATEEWKNFVTALWFDYFKKPIDTIPYSTEQLKEALRAYFFKCVWYEVYDFIEFIANYHPIESEKKEFMKDCNELFERELSAYRFVGGKITPITSEKEISEIEEALETPFKTVKAHIENALKLMSDRKSPDYRNSIKESISAVEAICRIIAKDEKATLGQALDAVERQGKIDLHPALKRAFDSLYGYASSAEGIRHALLDEQVGLSFEDSKFMLVSCSAFINYLICKVSKAKMLKT